MIIKRCWHCGGVDSSDHYIEDEAQMRYFHTECRSEYESERDNQLEEYIQLKIKVMHERALRMLEKQGAELNHYFDKSEAVLTKALETPSAFASSAEMIAGMELLRKEIRFKPEYTIGRRRVDFYIPELKVVLEIDGHFHKGKELQDSKRDVEVLSVLNKDDSGWEVVRIPTSRIEENSKKLVNAIIAIANYRRKERSMNNGFLKQGTSKHQDVHYENVLK